MKIRRYRETDFNEVLDTINDSARAYEGHIPADCYHAPYMTDSYLASEINDGVEFYCTEDNEKITGVMGIQDRGELFLIRHAYIRTSIRRSGVGSRLLKKLLDHSTLPFLIGTWKGAPWAVDFYQKHGFKTVTEAEKELLLRTYWNLPERQIETSHVLGDAVFLDSPIIEKIKKESFR